MFISVHTCATHKHRSHNVVGQKWFLFKAILYDGPSDIETHVELQTEGTEHRESDQYLNDLRRSVKQNKKKISYKN